MKEPKPPAVGIVGVTGTEETGANADFTPPSAVGDPNVGLDVADVNGDGGVVEPPKANAETFFSGVDSCGLKKDCECPAELEEPNAPEPGFKKEGVEVEGAGFEKT